MKSLRFVPAALAAAILLAAPVARGDETCNSPYTAKLIKGQEDYVYVWTLGVEGL
ncbi:MAG TPA: selenium-binding protein, partial [Vicinamibacteria bacterium]|nr:selenium-binding protein [Vicinamibacteria bacterium]